MEVWRTDAGVKVRRAEETPEGYLKVWGVPAGVGVLNYVNEDGSLRSEYVTPEALRSSTASMVGKAITNEHPKGGKVTPDNHSEVALGVVLEAVYNEDSQEQEICCIIHNREGLDTVNVLGVRMLSPGYLAKVQPAPEGAGYDYIQVARENNHVAITKAGRGGPSKSLRLDSAGNVSSGEPMSQKADKQSLDEVAELQAKLDAANAKIQAFEAMEEQRKLDSTIEPEAPAVDPQAQVAFYNERRAIEKQAESFGIRLDSQGTNEDLMKAVVVGRLGEDKMTLDSESKIRAAYEVVTLVGPGNGASALADAVKGNREDSALDASSEEFVSGVNPWKAKFNTNAR